MRTISKLTTILIILCAFSASTIAQTMKETETRKIAVTGSAEKEITPDEIIFQITIKEYWKEELEKGTKYEDYKTKVPIEGIENTIIEQLYSAGVKEDQIFVSGIGNFWRQAGKDFLVSKTLTIHLSDFKVVDKIAKTVDSRGVSNMRIVELRHSKMEDYRKEVKIEALKAAKNKADYLLESIGEKCEKVLYIDESTRSMNPGWQYKAESNSVMRSADGGGGASADQIKKIKIRYEVYATFSIKD